MRGDLGSVFVVCCLFTHAVSSSNSQVLQSFQHALSLHSKGKVREAVTQYQRTIRLDPAHVASHLRLAHAMVQLGDHEHALDYFSRTRVIEPKAAEPLLGIGHMLSQLQRHAEAVPPLDRALALQSLHRERRPLVQQLLAAALAETSRHSESADVYKSLFVGTKRTTFRFAFHYAVQLKEAGR